MWEKSEKIILEGEIPTQFRAKAEQSFTNLPTPPWKTENKEQSSQLSLFLVFYCRRLNECLQQDWQMRKQIFLSFVASTQGKRKKLINI